jgi:hypothetical protein
MGIGRATPNTIVDNFGGELAGWVTLGRWMTLDGARWQSDRMGSWLGGSFAQKA